MDWIISLVFIILVLLFLLSAMLDDHRPGRRWSETNPVNGIVSDPVGEPRQDLTDRRVGDRIIRSVACIIIATVTAAIGLVWVRVPHAGASPGRQVSSTYNASVGMIDLYLLDDYGGFERLLAVDPGLIGIGGDAARNVAVNNHFQLEQRRYAAELLANTNRMDETFTETLAEVALANREEAAFCHIDPTLDISLGCRS